MADNYLMLDGKEYELSPEPANALRSCVEPEPEKESPFDRGNGTHVYYYIDSDGSVLVDEDSSSSIDAGRYATANFCSDESTMKQRAMHETLNRLLWRYSEEHGGDPKWNGENDHWLISAPHGCYKDEDIIYVSATKPFGAVFFKDKDTAWSAIEEIVKPFLAAHPDFVW